MRIAVIQFSETHDNVGILAALERAEIQSEIVVWQQAGKGLDDFDGFIVAGDFVYQQADRLEFLSELSAWVPALLKQHEQSKPILGLGNGSHILIESGLVPGVEGYKLSLGLACHDYTHSAYLRFSEGYQLNAFTRFIASETILYFPSDQKQNYFIIPPALALEVQVNGMNVLHYCDTAGNRTERVAAISNKAGNVMACYPAVALDAFLQSMKDYVVRHTSQKVRPLSYYPRPYEAKKWIPQGERLIVKVEDEKQQNALNKLGFQAKVTCYRYSESADSVTGGEGVDLSRGRCFLICSKETNQFSRQGVLWQLEAEETEIRKILLSNVLFNPLLEDCYNFNPAGLYGTF